MDEKQNIQFKVEPSDTSIIEADPQKTLNVNTFNVESMKIEYSPMEEYTYL